MNEQTRIGIDQLPVGFYICRIFENNGQSHPDKRLIVVITRSSVSCTFIVILVLLLAMKCLV